MRCDAYTRGSVFFFALHRCKRQSLSIFVHKLMAISSTDFSSSKLTSLISALESEKFTSETFRTYLAEVGGHGLGILFRPANASDLPTPPTQEDSDTLETTFANTSKAELRGWIEALGEWAYV